MSRKRPRKKINPIQLPSRPQAPQQSKGLADYDPEEIPVWWLVRFAKAKFGWKAIGILLVALSTLIYIVARFSQTDFVMELLGNQIRLQLEKERSDHRLEREAHNRTRQELEELKTNSQAQTAQLNGKIAALNSDLVAAREKHRILELFGEGFWLYRSYEIRKEIGDYIDIGRCGSGRCYRIKLLTYNLDDPQIRFGLWIPGTIPNNPDEPPLFVFTVTLKKGCRTKIFAKKIELLFAIESSEINSLRAGLSLKAADKEYGDFVLRGTECP